MRQTESRGAGTEQTPRSTHCSMPDRHHVAGAPCIAPYFGSVCAAALAFCSLHVSLPCVIILGLTVGAFSVTVT